VTFEVWMSISGRFYGVNVKNRVLQNGYFDKLTFLWTGGATARKRKKRPFFKIVNDRFSKIKSSFELLIRSL
jgi:hypothetical protein